MKAGVIIAFVCIFGLASAKLNPCASPKDTCTSSSECGGGYSTQCFQLTPTSATSTCQMPSQSVLKCNDTCSLSYQCSKGFRCKDGRCQYSGEGYAAPTFQKDVGCSCPCASGVCEGGVCMHAKYRWGAKCESGSECESGVCQDNVCLGKNGACTATSRSANPCAKGLRCVSGTCVAATADGGDCPPMSSLSPCAAGTKCFQTSSTNYRCKKYHFAGVGVECHAQEACEIGLFCNSTANRCDPLTPALSVPPDYYGINMGFYCGDSNMPLTENVCSTGADSVPVCNITLDAQDYIATYTAFTNCLTAIDITWELDESWLISMNPLDPNANALNHCLPEMAQMMCKGYLRGTMAQEYWMPLFDCAKREPREFNTTTTRLCGAETLPYLSCPADYMPPPKPNAAFSTSAPLALLLALIALLFAF